MSTAAIRDTIKLAKLHEQQNGQLLKLMEHYAYNNAHMSIQLPEQNPGASLVEFIVAYIENVPNFIDAVREITLEANIQDYAETYLQIAQDYFLKPREAVAEHVGLRELMDQAYLAHRLMEEVNDRFMLRSSIPLVPMDMTMSNLIVHSLIGEPFVNELDEAVQYTVECTTIKEHVYDSEEFKAYVASHKNNRWDHELNNWPCLTDHLAIRLQLAGM